MPVPQYLRPWLNVHQRALPLLLFIILLSAITQFAAFALSQNFVSSAMGAQPEDITMAFQLSYIGILFIFPIQFRLIRYFELRSYLLGAISIGIALSFACMYTHDLIVFFVIRFFQGIIVCIIAASMLTLFNIFLKPEHRQILSPSIFYGTILSSGVLIGIIFANVSLNDNWTEVYRYLICFQSFSLLIVLLCFNSRSGAKPYPLYQIDWKAAVFFLTAAISLAYTLIYGSKYYWWSDRTILFSGMLTLIATGLFIHKTLISKRPLVNLIVFQSPKFWVGILLLAFYYGIKDSLNLLFGYTTSVLQWSAPQMMSLGLFNIAGLLIFMYISGKLILTKKISIPFSIMIGFAVLLAYQLWMYSILSPDLSYADLVGPFFLQGAASGLLFVPLMLFSLSALNPTEVTSGLVIAAYVRFFALLNVSAGFYNLQLYYNQHFKEGFLAHVSPIDNTVSDRLFQYKQIYLNKGFTTAQAESLANTNLAKVLGQQTQLLSYKAIFMQLSYLVTGVLIVLVLFRLLVAVRHMPKGHQSPKS